MWTSKSRSAAPISVQPAAGWFDSYRTFITHYAALAKTYNVELFCLGTEIDGTVPGHEADWAAIVQAVRAAYPGQLTYASNWPSYQAVSFWKDLYISALTPIFR